MSHLLLSSLHKGKYTLWKLSLLEFWERGTKDMVCYLSILMYGLITSFTSMEWHVIWFFKWSKAVIYKRKCKVFCIIIVYVNIVLLFAMIKSHWWKWKLGHFLIFIWKEHLKHPMFYEWKYIENILKCFSMENCKSIKIPLIKGIILSEELYLNS